MIGTAILLTGRNDSKPILPYTPPPPPPNYQIDLYSGGVYLGSWTSVDFPEAMGHKSYDGYQFKDHKTGKYVRIMSDIVITELP